VTAATFKVRVGVVLPVNHKILLVRQNHRPFWVFPGGTLEPGEGLQDCAIREMKEETDLTVSIDRLLYVGDLMTPERQVVDILFLAHLIAGTLKLATDENLNEADYFSIEQIRTLNGQPAAMTERLLIDWPRGFQDIQQYVGVYGRP
jgi:8-oxo-dGTP diphosphatase